jgi:hypothetical protein
MNAGKDKQHARASPLIIARREPGCKTGSIPVPAQPVFG